MIRDGISAKLSVRFSDKTKLSFGENLWEIGFGNQPGFAKAMGHVLDNSLFSL